MILVSGLVDGPVRAEKNGVIGTGSTAKEAVENMEAQFHTLWEEGVAALQASGFAC